MTLGAVLAAVAALPLPAEATDRRWTLRTATAGWLRSRRTDATRRDHARVRGSAVVDQVHTERWIADIEVPAPACRIGVAGWDLLGALKPTDDPVTCAGACGPPNPTSIRIEPSSSRSGTEGGYSSSEERVAWLSSAAVTPALMLCGGSSGPV